MNWYDEVKFKCSLILEKLNLSKGILAKILVDANEKDTYSYQFITTIGFIADASQLVNNRVSVKDSDLKELKRLLKLIKQGLIKA